MLIQCPECSREISDAAASCPNCGYALADADKAKAMEKANEMAMAAKARSEREARLAKEKAAWAKQNNRVAAFVVLGLLLAAFIWSAYPGFGGDAKEQEANKCACLLYTSDAADE